LEDKEILAREKAKEAVKISMLRKLSDPSIVTSYIIIYKPSGIEGPYYTNL